MTRSKPWSPLWRPTLPAENSLRSPNRKTLQIAELLPKIQIHSAVSDEGEAEKVRQIIHEASPSRDVLVLYPERDFSIAIIKELRAKRIPFAIVTPSPGDGLPKVSSLRSWLTDPSDNLSFRLCVQAFLDSPASGVPSRFVKKRELREQREADFNQISQLWKEAITGNADSLWEALQLKRESSKLCSSACSAFARLLDLHTREMKAASRRDSHRNYRDFAAFSARLVRYLAPWRKVSQFLSEATSWVESQTEGFDQSSQVRLMTFHSAKGLEADVVCVLGLEEGTMPKQDASVPEEARKLFVSMTRAKDELHLFHTRKRSQAVAKRPVYLKGPPEPSRFLNAIPTEHGKPVWQPRAKRS